MGLSATDSPMAQPSTTPTTATGVTVRAATPDDAPLIAAMVRELADFEKLAHAARAEASDFVEALFCPTPRVFCEIACWNGEAAGLAIWFVNFSTFRGKHGLYLEDLYVRPAWRSHGLGKALLRHLAQRCIAEGLARMEWAVLDWNQPAIDFYRSQGAILLDDWTTCRLSGDGLAALGAAS